MNGWNETVKRRPLRARSVRAPARWLRGGAETRRRIMRRFVPRSSDRIREPSTGSTARPMRSPGLTTGRPCDTSTTAAPPASSSSSVSAPVGSTTMTSAGTEAALSRAASWRCSGACRRRRPDRRRRRRDPSGQRTPPSASTQALPSDAAQRAVDDVHRRRADELRDEQVVGMVVELERRADLLDAAVVHHDDAVGHRHRLDLVVRDVDRRRLQALVQRLDLGAHRDAQLGVEVRQRLVEQEDLRVAHDGASHRDALALSAGELARKALQVRVEIEDLRGVARRAPAITVASALRSFRLKRHVVGAPSCADRARSSGTPWRCRGPSTRRR